MYIPEQIKVVLAYIEAHVEEALDSDRLAAYCAYSKSHFFKLFTLYTGLTPMHYVLRRKLHYAAGRLLSGNERIADIAFRYGFESHDVFGRAFKRIYGITPEACRKRGYALQDMSVPVIIDQREGHDMDVQVLELPALHLVGVERPIGRTASGEDETTFGQVWEIYFSRWQELFGGVVNRVRPEDDADYAFSRFDERGRCYYFVGFEVDAPTAVPAGAVSATIPPRLCAKATHAGPPAATLGRTLDYLYGEWFLSSAYRTGHDRDLPHPVIEYYDGRTGGSPPEMDVFIPLKQPDDRVVEVEAYEAAVYRAVGSDRAKLKLEAFDKMINWVERIRGKLNGTLELGVRYGEVDAHDSFCEVFVKLEDDRERQCALLENKDIPVIAIEGGTYAVSESVHHFLEKDWATFSNRLRAQQAYKPVGGGYDLYRIEDGKADYYTSVALYERIEMVK